MGVFSRDYGIHGWLWSRVSSSHATGDMSHAVCGFMLTVARQWMTSTVMFNVYTISINSCWLLPSKKKIINELPARGGVWVIIG